MNVLNPTKAQRKAMALALARRVGRESYVQGDLDVVWHQIEAANSIPEGAPVGTIARRPDGGYIAIMNELGWEYFYLDVRKPRLDTDGDHADSWPQIRPDQWPDQSGLDWFPPGEEPLVTRPDPDPTAQQVPETCRICNGSGVGYGKVPGGWLETDCAACDATGEAQQEPVTARFSGVFTGTCMACQREQCDCHDNNDTPKPRIPRVVDRLGVDEQGSRWVNGKGVTYWFEDDRWYNQAEDEDTPFEFSVGYAPASEAPYTEIVEPRVLPSLDCEEARDGTVWGPVDDRVGRRYKFVSDSWKSKVGDEEWYTLRSMGLLEVRFGPFTEVIE